MKDFCFYWGEDPAVVERMRSAAAGLWGEVEERSAGSFWLFVPSRDYQYSFCEASGAVGAVSGYVRCEGLGQLGTGTGSGDRPHNDRFVSEIIEPGRWPLSSHWTGSFAAVACTRESQGLVLCNDLIGFFPLYFSQCESGVVGGTSLILLSRCVPCEPDPVGIVQRITPPNCNYGRRTVLKQFSRLLPGECLKFFAQQPGYQSIMDNSLCNGLIQADVNSVARSVWDCLQREIVLAVGINDRTCVALSGGWDSRLSLAGVAHRGETLDCYTYGGDDLYETGVARRCAEAVGARHEAFTIENWYFPPRPELEVLVRETEAANVLMWFHMIDAVKKRGGPKETILLGDMCESIDGRNMTELSSKEARKRSYVSGLLGRQDPIPAATSAAFDHWKEAKQKHLAAYVARHTDRLSPALAQECGEDTIARATAADLELSFQRVRDNMPAFTPQFDELFTWFHRVRFMMASQLLILSSTFRPLSPAMSVRFLRMISTVHPRLRMRKRVMDAMARLPEFDALARVPSAQIPGLSARAPGVLKELVWGARSTADMLLLKRKLRSKNPDQRQRVLRSLDYVREYRREGVVRTVEGWFSERWLRSEKYVEVVKSRAALAEKPYLNADIAIAANISIMLDLCCLGDDDLMT